MIDISLQPLVTEWLEFFSNPKKRIYWGYLVCAMLIGFIYVYINSKSFKYSFKKLFSYDSWLSKSAFADYKTLFFNSIFLFFMSSKLLTKTVVAYFIFYTLSDFMLEESIFYGSLENWQVSLLFTVTLFIFDDFTKYWVHRWLHTVDFLWSFHKVHHSATALNFFTVFRIHPVEAVLFSLRTAFVQGLIIGLFFFLFGNQVSLMMVLGANLFNFLFNVLGSNLRHSPIALPYPKFLENIFLSPAQHHIHHSLEIKHRNKNFGVVFSIWDRIFKSFHYSEKKDLKYGLNELQEEKEHKIFHIYFSPIIDSFYKLKSRIFNYRLR